MFYPFSIQEMSLFFSNFTIKLSAQALHFMLQLLIVMSFILQLIPNIVISLNILNLWVKKL